MKLKYQGREADVTRLSFSISNQPWTEVLAEDSTVLRVQVVPTDVLRLEGQLDELGQQMYLLRFQNVIVSLPTDSKEHT